ncbi:family 20 glycosylhydrolase [Verrucomicrobiaceae bacterium N1E253]|uniref:Family 20 glycosylhydrolase n=1 Tax=Oceaniferula marina TaxID=2748318 RepID=A0A851GP22_9BACT|nr:glycoside hydrolase family 20 protein [Oceaniferula marina]NWK57621.1 family 20 glycosylhydrolase [Oceaniferula marina]
MKPTILSLSLVLGGLIPLEAAPNPQPHTVPAVQSWDGAEGSLKPNLSSIFINPSQQKALKPIADLLASELPGTPTVLAKTDITPGSIVLTLDKQIKGKESYQIVIGKYASISAGTPAGIFYGTRTLQQLLRSGTLPKGTIKDAPQYPVRSVLVDVGRKFMPVPQLKDWIRIMGWMKINELHLHLNDNSWGRYPGYRLESKKFPGLASEDGHYTFKEIRELQDFAKLHGVVIVPEIDSPGHSLAFTTYRPELAQKEMNRNGFGLAYLDLANPDAIRFMEQIWDEVCPLFDAELVHIGTDEYRIGLIKDKKEREEMGERFRKYINHLNNYITTKHGKTVRTWSGYEHLPGKTEPDTSIIIDMWETSDAKNKVAAGYKVVNSSHFYTYIVPGAPYYGVNNTFIYDKWTPMQFSGKPEGQLSPEDPGLMGGKLHVWNDYGPSGYTWNEITRLTIPAMAAMGEKLWGTKGAANHKAFQEYANPLIENIPLVTLTQRQAVAANDTVWNLEKAKLLIPNTNPELKLKADNLEWPWTASVTLTRHNDVKGDEILLSSDLAAFYLDLTHKSHDKKQKKDITRRGVACVRANQAYGHEPITSNNPDILIFDYQVPLDQKVTLTFVGEQKRTSLYVDGKLIQSIGKQMVCPLTRMGDKLPRGPHATLHTMSIKSSALESVQIGTWSSGKVSEQASKVSLDLSKALRSPGNYQVVFQYTGGLHRMDIDKVELLENGKVIHSDEHPGITGGKSSDNVYNLPVKQLKPGARYSLRATMHSDGGTDSNGTITLQQMP